MHEQSYIWNKALDNANACFFHHILSCDIKLVARRFIYANSPCPYIFHRTSAPPPPKKKLLTKGRPFDNPPIIVQGMWEGIGGLQDRRSL